MENCMSEFVALECKYCGNVDRGAFTLRENEYICKCCGRAYRKNMSGGEARSAAGFENLKSYSFEAAEDIFADIISEYPDSVDARWGLLLARYGIVFVKGFYTEEVEPIYCFPNYRYSKGAFRDEPEYKEIEELLRGDADRMALYKKHAEKIEAAFSAFRSDIGKKENDVFICVKISKTTANNPSAVGFTEDYEKACELYDKLTKAGKQVFFSYVTLKNTIDSDMSIWRNMLKSKKMLLIGSRTEYFSSVWVKSEWERWLWLDSAGGDEHRKNLYIYVMGDENEKLYAKLPAGLKKLNPQIYTEATEADLINDICYEGKKKPDKKPESPKKAEPKPEKPPKPEKITRGKGGYVEYLDGTRQEIPYGGDVDFSGRSNIVRVMLPESVTETGSWNFRNCPNLETVYLPKTLKKIGERTFSGCAKLTSVKIPKGVEEIGRAAFSDCVKLSSVEIPVGVTEINIETFRGCKSLASVKLPEGLRAIGEHAFSYCESLKKMELPKTLWRIGDSAFASSGLGRISIPKAVLNVGNFAFARCHKLRKIEFCDTIESIGNGAFDFDVKAKIFYQGERSGFNRVYKGNNAASLKIIYQSRSAAKRSDAKVTFGIILLLALIAAAVIIPMYVPGSLHWCIAIAGGIILNAVSAAISYKYNDDVHPIVNGIELFIFVLLLIMSAEVKAVIVFELGIALGALPASIFLTVRGDDIALIYLILDAIALAIVILSLIFGAQIVLGFIFLIAIIGFIGYIISLIFGR